MRRLANGDAWDVELPFSNRGDYWACVDGRTYLSDNCIVLRLDVVTVSDQPQIESKLFTNQKARDLVDRVAEFHSALWETLPPTLPLRKNEAGTEFCLVEVFGRSLDFNYFLWLQDHFGVPEAAVLRDNPGEPIHFRFRGGFAALMPVVDREEG